MAGKDYLRGMLLSLLWFGLLLVILYMAARLADTVLNMRWCMVFMLAAWPLLAGALAGWQAAKAEKNGFAAGLRWVSIPLLLAGMLWWWLLPQLWQAGLYAKFALYVCAAAILSGGLGLGLAKARQILYPPRPDAMEEDIEDIEDIGDKEDKRK